MSRNVGEGATGLIFKLAVIALLLWLSWADDDPLRARVEATKPVTDGSGNVVLDLDSTPDRPIVLIHSDTDFVIYFNRPVHAGKAASNTGCRELIFDGDTEVSLVAQTIQPDGAPAGAHQRIPFSCMPLLGNDRCAYKLHPIAELPRSADLGNPPFNDPQVTQFTRTRLFVQLSGPVLIYDPQSGPPRTAGVLPRGIPANRKALQARQGAAFTVMSAGRYAACEPDYPNAVYFAMESQEPGLSD